MCPQFKSGSCHHFCHLIVIKVATFFEGWFINYQFANVAQLVEPLICNQLVGGSSPLIGSIFEFYNTVVGFPSGQREQTVNLSAKPSKVRILPPPPLFFLYRIFFRAGVAQLARALAFQAKGREFESRFPLHFCV